MLIKNAEIMEIIDNILGTIKYEQLLPKRMKFPYNIIGEEK